MPLQFDSSPYLQVWQAQRQRDQEEAQRPQVENQNILQALQMLAESKRQQQLMDMQKQQFAATQSQQQMENEYKFGKQIDPNIDIGVPRGTMGQSRLFGNQPMQTGTGMPLRNAFDAWRAGGMKPVEARPEFMGALGQDERKQFYENANPKFSGPKSIDGILAQKVSNGEMTLEDAVKMKQQSSGGSFMMGGMTEGGAPVFYNTKDPSNVKTGTVPGGGILYPKTPPEGAMNASLFGQRALEANQQLNEMIGKDFDPTNIQTGATRYLPNYFQPANMQKFQQAKTNFVNAVLRKESGALISNEEMASADKQYFPQVGDSPEVLSQKETNRITAIQGLNRMAGPMGNSNTSGDGLPKIGQSFQGGTVKSIRRVR